MWPPSADQKMGRRWLIVGAPALNPSRDQMRRPPKKWAIAANIAKLPSLL
jgi:hypothetical protein